MTLFWGCSGIKVLLLHFVLEINKYINNNGGYEYPCYNIIGNYYYSCNIINSDNYHCHDIKIINTITSSIV